MHAPPPDYLDCANQNSFTPPSKNSNQSTAHIQASIDSPSFSPSSSKQVALGTHQRRSSPNDSFPPSTHSLTQMNRYLLATAKLVATIAAITPTIPKNHSSPVLFFPGTGTFIPKSPQIKFSGTRIVARSVILLKTWLARLPCLMLSTDSWAR